MLSGVLRSPVAIATNIHIMRAFNAMRHFIGSHAQVFQRLEVMERNQLALNAHQEELASRQESTDKKIEEVFKRLDAGDAVPKEMVFFKGEIIVGKQLLPGVVTESQATYDRLYERLKKAFQRGTPVRLKIVG